MNNDTDHNHEKCIKTTISKARQICNENNVNLTPLREKILEIIFRDHKPVKAYDVLNELKKHKISNKPPTIYRALDFFIENKIIRKIHSINSYYVHYQHINKNDICHFLICKECNNVQEICDKSLANSILRVGNNNGFKMQNNIIEVLGLCEKCS